MGPSNWRRGRDSNPRYSFGPYTGLANQRLQPLGHLSRIAPLSALSGATPPPPSTGARFVPHPARPVKPRRAAARGLTSAVNSLPVKYAPLLVALEGTMSRSTLLAF